MAWVTIAASDYDPDSPITTTLASAWSNNPTAIANGDSGAPSIQTAALIASERMTSANVLAASASASAGEVGTYAILKYKGVDTTISFGETKPASELRVSSAIAAVDGPVPSGTTWRSMGYSTSAVDDVMIWVRTV